MFDEQQRNRKPLRLRHFNYASPGAYFVTICTDGRVCRFGHVSEGRMFLNAAGTMVDDSLRSLPRHYPGVGIDCAVVMPNHVHAIVTLGRTGLDLGTTSPIAKAASHAPAPPSLVDVIGRWKSFTTRLYIDGVRSAAWPAFPKRLWHRSFHEHIIRDIDAVAHFRNYILQNPAQWPHDPDNPAATPPT